MLNYLINQETSSSWILSINYYRPLRLRSLVAEKLGQQIMQRRGFFSSYISSSRLTIYILRRWKEDNLSKSGHKIVQLYTVMNKTYLFPFFFKKVYMFWSLDILTLKLSDGTWAEIMCQPTRIWLNWFLRPLRVFQTPHLIHLILPAARYQRDYGFPPARRNWFRMREV